MLSTHSFNALLKTLEEPPPHVKFLFATTDPQKLPVTILSRCLQFNLRRINIKQIAGHLDTILQAENIKYEVTALDDIAKAADGSMRDALSLLDQAITHGAGAVITPQVHDMLGTISQQQLYLLIQALVEQDAQALITQSNELSIQGRDFTQVINDLLNLFQRIATLQMVPNIEDNDGHDLNSLRIFAEQLSPEIVQLFYQIALHGKRDLPYAANPKSGFEMTLLRMLSFEPTITPTDNSPDSTKAHVKKTLIPESALKEKTDNITSQSSDKKIVEHPEKSISTKFEIIDKTESPILNSDNWLTVIDSLKLTALARQLADNCAFIDFAQGKITLRIAAELAHLTGKKPQERLEAVISKHLKQTISLVFQENIDTLVSSTIATEKAQQANNDQDRANASIHNDPAITAMKDAFGARVIESTIKSIK
jgi:DNA polymerase-3 subunit gamma/tau